MQPFGPVPGGVGSFSERTRSLILLIFGEHNVSLLKNTNLMKLGPDGKFKLMMPKDNNPNLVETRCLNHLDRNSACLVPPESWAVFRIVQFLSELFLKDCK